MRNKSRKQLKEVNNCDYVEEKQVIEEKNDMNDQELNKILKGDFPEKIYKFFENMITIIIKTTVFLFKASFFYILFNS